MPLATNTPRTKGTLKPEVRKNLIMIIPEKCIRKHSNPYNGGLKLAKASKYSKHILFNLAMCVIFLVRPGSETLILFLFATICDSYKYALCF